jgi:hypothetical protein
VQIKALIADSFGSDAAEVWERLSLTQPQIETLRDAGQEVLAYFPTRPGACLLMSAVYAIRLEKIDAAPAYVIAGSLYAGDTRVFGEDSAMNGRERFSRPDPSWNGHAWIISGNYLADVSIFRTAYSQFSPPLLAAHVRQEFGIGKGLMICKIEEAIRSGLRYEAQYVLNRDQVDALFFSAKAIATGAGPSRT